MSRYRRASAFAAGGGRGPRAGRVTLAGCDALGKLGTTGHYPAATSFTVGGRVTTVVIDAGSGSVDVTAASRSTVGGVAAGVVLDQAAGPQARADAGPR